MGPRAPKKPDTIGLQAEESGAFTLRVPAWLSRKAVAGLAAALMASTGGAWLGVQRVEGVGEQMAAQDRRMAGFVADMSERLERIEAASYARSEATAVLTRDLVAVRSEVADLKAAERERVAREIRAAERAGRSLTRTR